jgi:hypothetical protein
MRSLSVWLTACSCTLALAGCGGQAKTAAQPKLPRALARQLAAQSNSVASSLDANQSCAALAQAQALQQATTAAINAHRVPAALQQQLRSTATDLVERIRCTPPVLGPDKSIMHGSDNAKRGKHKKPKHHGDGQDGGGEGGGD